VLPVSLSLVLMCCTTNWLIWAENCLCNHCLWLKRQESGAGGLMEDNRFSVFRATEGGADFHAFSEAVKQVPRLRSLTSRVKSGLAVSTRVGGWGSEEGGGWGCDEGLVLREGGGGGWNVLQAREA